MAKAMTPSCRRRSNPSPHSWNLYPYDERYEFCRFCGQAHMAAWYQKLSPAKREKLVYEKPIQHLLFGHDTPAIDPFTRGGKKALREQMRQMQRGGSSGL